MTRLKTKPEINGDIDEDAQRGAHSVLDMLLAEVDRADAERDLTSIPRFAEGAQFILEMLSGQKTYNLDLSSTEEVERVVGVCREVVELLLVLKETFTAERLRLFLTLSNEYANEIRVRIHDGLFIVIEWSDAWVHVFTTDNPFYDADDTDSKLPSIQSPHGRRSRIGAWWKTALRDVEQLVAEIVNSVGVS